jgi:hypothetical protein
LDEIIINKGDEKLKWRRNRRNKGIERKNIWKSE